MLIKRLRVEEGFFNLLDLTFSEGLNVLVGGRGVGKTSIIELIRFGLGISNLSDGATRESFTHAVSILQSSGRVIIDIEVNGQTISVSRSATEDAPDNLNFMAKPIILSQKEVETVSLNAAGKLNLIDSFTNNYSHENLQINTLASEIKSNCATMLQSRREYEEAISNTRRKNELLSQEATLLEQKKKFETDNSILAVNQDKYNSLQNELSVVELDINSIVYLINTFEHRTKELKSLLSTPQIGDSKSSNTNAINKKAILFLEDELKQIQNLVNENINFTDYLQKELSNLHLKKNSIENSSRDFRATISKVTENGGLILSSLNHIRNQLSHIISWENIAISKKDHLSQLYNIVQEKLTKLTEIRKSIYQKRLQICEQLNTSLNPMVMVAINHSSDNILYKDELRNALKGSGLKYNEIIDDIVSKVHPQWLFYYIFTDKFAEFSEMVNIPLDRATRLLSYLNEVDLGRLITVEINDEVNMFLLDKGSYKRVEELSIGQRCTVSLSLILENKNRVLIIDQPEDHLDNEFITSTLIKSITKRSSHSQTIISSHNANIPVLGQANLVINLDSNGRRGFIKHIGPVNQNDIRLTIESIMEGGKEAFQFRSDFYLSN